MSFKAGVLNSSPRDPLLCILCMSPLLNTPDSDPQLIKIDSTAILTSWGSESGVLNKGDIHNMQSSGSRGLELRTPALKGYGPVTNCWNSKIFTSFFLCVHPHV